ncbi:MAG: nickel/cobalt transporter (NiCoT) family protein [Thermoleophilaceae bacterium]|jgi:high-affinity nickel-transport protein|nr:nickel/cobalt transporter (NiCoT) family protein [Thermoleophilaceae bacterium]
MRRLKGALTREEWLRLGGFGTAVAAMHLAGWGLFVYYSRHHVALAGLGTLAYTFGLRHAFDADHIAAIDNTTRSFLGQGRRSMGVGFFFSLGHSTVVFLLAVGLAVAARSVNAEIPAFRHYGGTIGTSVSGVFLLLIGVLNLIVLLDIVRIFHEMKSGGYDRARLEERLLDRGFMNRFFLGRFARMVRKSWHMYPLGLLFGLGFDTATEVGLLALAAGVATNHVPFLAVLSLPILFASGMCLMDTIDGAFMSKAYGWAFANPVRRIYYNITVTGLSVAVALAIGGVEVLQVLSRRLSLGGGFWDFVGGIDFGSLGYAIVGLFVLTWVGAAVLWRTRRIEQRWGSFVD